MTQDKNYWINRDENDSKKDWDQSANTWVQDYKDSVNHLHRDKLVEIIEDLHPHSVFEIGASCGPNLKRIEKVLPTCLLKGIDVSPLVVEQAMYDGLEIAEGDVLDIPTTGKFDLVLCDAVLMYVEPKDIKKAFDEIDRIALKYIVLVEWYNESLMGVEKDYHWARDYKSILEFYGFRVESIKIDETIWKTKTWRENGRIFIARRQSKISEKN